MHDLAFDRGVEDAMAEKPRRTDFQSETTRASYNAGYDAGLRQLAHFDRFIDLLAAADKPTE